MRKQIISLIGPEVYNKMSEQETIKEIKALANEYDYDYSDYDCFGLFHVDVDAGSYVDNEFLEQVRE